MERRTALRTVGRVTQRWAAWRESQRRRVLDRARYACEACKRYDRYVRPFWHHLVGRDDEPWSSSEALTVALCNECHIPGWHDGHMPEEVRSGLLWDGAKRLLVIVRGPGASLNDFTEWDPEDVINLLLREAHARGLEPPGYHEETR